jgi:hypothetical protein
MSSAAMGQARNMSRREPALTRSAFTFRLLHVLNLLCMVAQLAIDFRYDNIISATIIFLSTGSLLFYLVQTKACETYIISSFMLLGLCVTSQFGALLVQSLTWTPVAEGLRIPVQTFSHLAGLQLVATMAHFTFRHVKGINNIASGLSKRVLTPMGVLAIPSPANLWLLGMIGFAAQLSGGSAVGNVMGKVIDGLRFMAWCPFLIPIYYVRLGPAYCDKKKQFTAVVGYLGMAIVLGLALNVRTIMLLGATTTALLFLMLAMQDKTPLKPGAYLKFMAGCCVFGLALVALGDVAKAMVIAREKRGLLSPVEVLTTTVEALFDRTKLDSMTKSANLDPILGLYDEQYLPSPVLSRFIDTKFHDNTLFYGSILTDANLESLGSTTFNQIMAVLPDPVLRAFGININKYEIQYSVGDYITNLSYGLPLGGYKTGSALGQGISLFGFLFYPLYFVIALILFTLNEAQRRIEPDGSLNICPVILISAFYLFLTGLTAESLATLSNILRIIPQNIIVFAAMYWLARRVSRPYTQR